MRWLLENSSLERSVGLDCPRQSKIVPRHCDDVDIIGHQGI